MYICITKASKGKGKGKVQGKGKGEHIHARGWWEFTEAERCQLGLLWAGKLDERDTAAAAARRTERVQAKRFRM